MYIAAIGVKPYRLNFLEEKTTAIGKARSWIIHFFGLIGCQICKD